MGCDIHLQVEAFDSKTGRWRNVVGAIPEGYAVLKWRGSEERCVSVFMRAPDARHYHVFAFLADVRNSDDIAPQFANRGLPSDMDGDENTVDVGEHSQTWATLAELLAAPWEVEATTSGWISFADWREWIARRETAADPRAEWPKSWCMDVGGGGVTHAQADELRALPDLGAARAMKERSLYVFDRWTCQPVARSAFREWLTSPTMRALAREFGADKVRVLMGFDS